MSLKNKIAKEDKLIKQRAANLFNLYKNEIGKIIDKYSDKIMLELSKGLLTNGQDFTYKQLMQFGILKHIDRNIHEILNDAAIECESYWSVKRKYFDLFSRVSMTYLSRKSSPPWLKTKLKLDKPLPMEGRFDPGKGHFVYYFSQMADQIMQQIQRGYLNEQSTAQVINRVKNMFNRRTKKNVKEQASDNSNERISGDMSLYGPIDMTFGFFSEADIAKLQEEMISARGFEYRQYRPWFSEALRANNKSLVLLENMLIADTLNLISSGQIESAPYLKGIEDLEWTVDRPGVCEYCDARAGLTHDEIKKQVKDKYGDDNAPIHPNCRCSYVPKISGEWQDSDLENQGVTWDIESGNLKIPKAVKEQYRLDLNMDEFIDYLKQGGGQ